ncbi:adenylate/guanylate cyclase [Xenorhabdus lircayensis]|uniref:Adenylate/guanylate cyclase n=1 Tax=Xenorhabdus lircayensis TaxID=2763499 RepID=A0ABS0UA48_9GAMM|nr:adenylate/guanylate cyclase [Xenorhabdus lircayensis]MBI6550759.1 adenylate/guanylate cyclase [Xenorhabdus lircayensis]
MLSLNQKTSLRKIINDSLNKAEKHWRDGGYLLALNRVGFESVNASAMDSAEPSKIPGHTIVQDGETVIDTFIAFVADMRDSSKHLMCATSPKKSKVSGLERVYYETSALLPAIGYVVREEEGNVTEYLGDGALALFRVEKDNKKEAIYAAHRAAKNAIGDARDIVNEILKERYELPELDIGVGLAISQTLVTLVGYPEKHPKAFGECVFRATKLSSGRNEIISDINLKAIWPSSKGGTLRFTSKSINNVDGYVLGTAT